MRSKCFAEVENQPNNELRIRLFAHPYYVEPRAPPTGAARGGMSEHDNARMVRPGSTAAGVATASGVAVASGGRAAPRVDGGIPYRSGLLLDLAGLAQLLVDALVSQ